MQGLTEMSSPIPLPKVAFILQVKITIDAKDKEAFLSHFRPAYNRVLAEPECAYFIVAEDIQEPGVFRWTEGWTKDAQWFMAVCSYVPHSFLPRMNLRYHSRYQQEDIGTDY